MGMPHATGDWTAAMARALPDDGRRHEVVDGELLVTPAPSWDHQRVVGAFYRALDAHLVAHRIGEVVLAPADVELDDRTLVQPDLFVIPLVAGMRPTALADVGGRLLLVIEVLSPSTARADRDLKRRRYRRAGIPEYWIVDADARVVERWRAGEERPEIVTDALDWTPADGAAVLRIDLAELFGAALRG